MRVEFGGISSGQEIIVSFAVKPTSSILKVEKQLINLENTTISVKGRYDSVLELERYQLRSYAFLCFIRSSNE